jgi:ectoine hydroxylase-related dioxygenase (phytanoyl-CoA dioxygenase family)
MSQKLRAAEIKRYEDDGFIAPISVLSPQEVSHYRGCLERLLETHSDDPNLATYLYDKTHLVFTWYDALTRHPGILDAVEDLLGSDILLWTSSILIKRPHTPSHFTWHQDSTYWGLEPPVALTVWLALSDATADNGCMRAIPASHKLGQLPHLNTFDKDVMLLRGQRVAVPLEEDKAVDLMLRPGEISIHQVRMVHGSGPNRSDGLRIGCTMVFIPTYTRQTGERESAMLMRGKDEYGHFDPEPRPQDDMDAAARSAHRAAVGRMQTYKPQTDDQGSIAVPS